jgi:hypothetical protein
MDWLRCYITVKMSIYPEDMDNIEINLAWKNAIEQDVEREDKIEYFKYLEEEYDKEDNTHNFLFENKNDDDEEFYMPKNDIVEFVKRDDDDFDDDFDDIEKEIESYIKMNNGNEDDLTQEDDVCINNMIETPIEKEKTDN